MLGSNILFYVIFYICAFLVCNFMYFLIYIELERLCNKLFFLKEHWLLTLWLLSIQRIQLLCAPILAPL